MKKRICLLSILVFMLSLSINVYAKSELRFTDVSENSWYYKDLVELVSKGIIDGFPDNTFKGTSQLNRDQLLKLLITTVNPRGFYEKAPDETWFAPYYKQCYSFGIETNVQTKKVYYETFAADELVVGDLSSYNKPIPRSEVCKYAANAYLCGHKMSSIEHNANKSDVVNELLSKSFSDYNLIPEDAKRSIYLLVDAGIIKGNDDGTFNPNGYLTRAEATAIVKRLRDARNKLVAKNEVDFESLKTSGYVYSADGQQEAGSNDTTGVKLTSSYKSIPGLNKTTKEIENIFKSKESIEENLGLEFAEMSDEELNDIKEYFLSLATDAKK